MRRSEAVPVCARVVAVWTFLLVASVALVISLAAGAMFIGHALTGLSDGQPVGLMALQSPNQNTAAETDGDAITLEQASFESPESPASPSTSSAHPPTPENTAEISRESDRATDDRPRFDGRRIEPVRTLDMNVTAYSPDERSCGIYADGITASGYSVWTNGMRLVAADTDLLPMGTIVTVPGYNDGKPVQVLDRGGAIKGRRLDVLFGTHERALQWGRQDLNVTVWRYADEDSH